MFGCGHVTPTIVVILSAFWRQFEREYEFLCLFFIRDTSVQLLQHKDWKRRAG